ncbi:MAG TPA: ABC transporter ATP-binding protein [Crocinitomicaceae bacterium]|nr:ABC transporter ATP-binding protein [Crocinitomicaceae bacterium]
MNNDIAIKVENLSKVFPLRQPQEDENGNLVHEHWALKDVSFEIKKGESVGIIGPNGSGKSTLLKILAGVTKPTSGKITIKGKVASILDIGAGFHPELSGRENVFLNGQIHGFSKKEIEAKFDEIVAFSGIEKFIDEPVKNYSNGMYLRLAFSIMAHLDFDVYLFDEVMSVGDVSFSHKAKSKINELSSNKKTIVVVSHNIPELEDFSNNISIEKGRIKMFSDSNMVLSNYINRAMIIKSLIETPSTISNFDGINTNSEINLLGITVSQKETAILQNNKELKFTIHFEKLNSKNQTTLALKIRDIMGGNVLSTTPLLNGLENIQNKGCYTAKCIFPAYFFGYQPYSIDLYFINQNIHESPTQNSAEIANRIVNCTYKYESIVSFKMQFTNLNEQIKKMNFTSGLFMKLEWDIVN